jgi:ferredoxin, 2Fe-2S
MRQRGHDVHAGRPLLPRLKPGGQSARMNFVSPFGAPQTPPGARTGTRSSPSALAVSAQLNRRGRPKVNIMSPVQVTFIESNGNRRTIDAAEGEPLMRAARKAGVRGIIAECGGSAMCATCHCYALETPGGALPALLDDERDTIEFNANARKQPPDLPDHRDAGAGRRGVRGGDRTLKTWPPWPKGTRC